MKRTTILIVASVFLAVAIAALFTSHRVVSAATTHQLTVESKQVCSEIPVETVCQDASCQSTWYYEVSYRTRYQGDPGEPVFVGNYDIPHDSCTTNVDVSVEIADNLDLRWEVKRLKRTSFEPDPVYICVVFNPTRMMYGDGNDSQTTGWQTGGSPSNTTMEFFYGPCLEPWCNENSC